MPASDPSVNARKSGERYHHGDLRSALLEEGLARLEAGPAEALSLREIARNVGVSATAVYRHFPDKAALIRALCDVGGERMTAAFQTAMAAAPDKLSAFDAMGRAYVRFALANPSLFRLMMTQDRGKTDADLASARHGGMRMLTESLDSLLGPETPRSARAVKRMQAWSLVHGLAMLMLDGQIPVDDAVIDQVVQSSLVHDRSGGRHRRD
jgi:AcrR family transcriptional regulator